MMGNSLSLSNATRRIKSSYSAFDGWGSYASTCLSYSIKELKLSLSMLGYFGNMLLHRRERTIQPRTTSDI